IRSRGATLARKFLERTCPKISSAYDPRVDMSYFCIANGTIGQIERSVRPHLHSSRRRPRKLLMRIGIYGAGYLGTVVAACLADFGTPVLAYDDDTARVLSLAEGNIPFYEKNLKDMLRRNLRSGRMTYSTELEPFARRSQVIYFAADSSLYIE